MPAVTLAGALALAGCGGSDNPPPTGGGETTTCTAADGKTFKIPGKGTECPAVTPTPPDKESQQALVDARQLRFKIGEAFERADGSRFSMALKTTKTAAGQGSGFDGGEDFDKADEDLRFLGKLMKSEGDEIGAAPITIGTADGEHAKADEFSKGSEKEHKANDRTKDATVFTTSGSYKGVPGVFSCTPNEGMCKSKIGNNGKLELIKGDDASNWMFTATDPKSRYAPETIAEYGWWLTEYEPGGDLRHVAVFHDPKNSNKPNSLDFGGSATYEGEAAGLYALNVGAGEDNDHGSFKADVALTAKFGTNASLEGTVDGFMVGEDHDEPRRGWKIELVKTVLDGTGTLGAARKDLAESVKWTVGGDTDDKGRWDAQMYGANDKEPGFVLGSFGATHDKTDGRIIGTFGAEHDEE